MKSLKYNLLERIQASPGLNLKDVYRPILKGYSESSIYSISNTLKEEGMVKFDSRSNEILVFASGVTIYDKSMYTGL